MNKQVLVKVAGLTMLASAMGACMSTEQSGKLLLNRAAGVNNLRIHGDNRESLSINSDSELSFSVEDALGYDPEVTVRQGTESVTFSIPEDTLNQGSITAKAEAIHQYFDLRGSVKRRTLKVSTEAGRHSCTYMGYCYSMGKWGFHAMCMGSQDALYERTDYEDVYSVYFQKPGTSDPSDAYAVFQGDPRFDASFSLIKTTSDCD